MLFETSLTTTPVFGLRRDMNRLFDDMLSRTMPSNAWLPPVDVQENQNEIALSVELPGVNPADVEVTCDGGVLSIVGQKQVERKEGDESQQYHLVERSYGSFSRSFRLPKGVDESKITADFEHGVLNVRVPKAALPQPKRINISSTSSGPSQQAIQGQGTSSSSASGRSSTGGESAQHQTRTASKEGSGTR